MAGLPVSHPYSNPPASTATAGAQTGRAEPFHEAALIHVSSILQKTVRKLSRRLELLPAELFILESCLLPKQLVHDGATVKEQMNK